MMFDTITTVDALSKYRGLEKRLKSFGRDISKFKSRSISDINHIIEITEGKVQSIMEDSSFNSYAQNPEYVREKLTLDAFKLIRNIKESKEASEVFVPGYTYYDCRTVGNKVSGKKCYFINEGKALWSTVNKDARVLKALEIMEHGGDDDFRKIYLELADGLPLKSVQKFCLEHITKSSDTALNEMAAYADTRWDGKWPWQIKTSRKLTRTIKENTTMVRNSLRNFREEYKATRRKIAEGELEKSEITLKLKGVADDIVSMIEKLGKTSGALITDMRDQVRTEFGDQHLAGLETISKETITHAVDALSDLKQAIEKQVDEMTGQGSEPRPEFDDPTDMSGAPNPGDMSDFDEQDPDMGDNDDAMGGDDFDADQDDNMGAEDDIDLDAELGIGVDERKKK